MPKRFDLVAIYGDLVAAAGNAAQELASFCQHYSWQCCRFGAALCAHLLRFAHLCPAR